MNVNILISTIDEGINQVQNVTLDPREDVKYIISHQYTDNKYKYIPDELVRGDITISQIEGKGLTKSRNNAIKIASGDIALLSDDDVTYTNADIETIKKTFLENSDVDVAIFKIRTPPGEPEYKKFSDEIIEYKRAPFVGSVQIAFKLDSIKEKGILFDERFGAGQELLICGEEKLFIQDCINDGLKVVYFPEYIVEHPYLNTGKAIPAYDIRRNWVEGGLQSRLEGPIALPKAFLGMIKVIPRLLKHRVNPLRYLYQRISAVIYVLRTNRKRHNNY